MPVTINGSGPIGGVTTLTNLDVGGLPNGVVTPTDLSQPFTSGTAVSASGTSVGFTDIPSWVKRITFMISDMSTTGSSDPIIQIGSGSYTTSGYSGYYFLSTSYRGTISSGIYLDSPTDSSSVINGIATICLMGSNRWVFQSVMTDKTYALASIQCTGNVVLSGTLDRVRLTTMGGSNTFDAGTINILYE